MQVYGALSHLPTFIEFRGGKEVGRIPHLYEGAARLPRRGWIGCSCAAAGRRTGARAQGSLLPACRAPHLAAWQPCKPTPPLPLAPPSPADGTISSTRVKRQDIITAFGLEDHKKEAEAAAVQGGSKPGGGSKAGGKAGSGSAKKRR